MFVSLELHIESREISEIPWTPVCPLEAGVSLVKRHIAENNLRIAGRGALYEVVADLNEIRKNL